MNYYSKIRETIKSGDLIAFSHGDWKSWSGIKTLAVRLFTGSTYSHVGIAWVVGERVFLLDAVKPRLRIFPLSLESDFYHIPLGAKWNKEAEEFALSKVGTPYSELAAIKAYFDPLPQDNVQECAAYAIAVLRRCGVGVGTLARPDTVVQKAQELGAPVIFVRNK